jgi:hypothetical protein
MTESKLPPSRLSLAPESESLREFFLEILTYLRRRGLLEPLSSIASANYFDPASSSIPDELTPSSTAKTPPSSES